jgi:hypothetical protein
MSLDFEDACLNPYQANFDDGHREGSEAGLEAGYNEGRKLGQQKAIEVGIELGYMRGVAEAVGQDMTSSLAPSENDNDLGMSGDAGATCRKVDKIRKSVDELLSMIDAFPSPDEIFHQAPGEGEESVDQLSSDKGSLNDDEGDSEHAKTRASGPVDISGRMQRIRAKFKLLCVQLKMPEVSLTKVMEEAKKDLGERQSINNKKKKPIHERRLAPEEVNLGGDQDW